MPLPFTLGRRSRHLKVTAEAGSDIAERTNPAPAADWRTSVLIKGVHSWGPPKVRLELPPQYGVHLLAWGADPDGAWWALVTWERYIAHHFEAPQQLWCSAWAPAATVQRVEHEDYSRVPRLRLDGDRRWWPTPPGPKLGHYGLLTGDELEPPEGYRWCSPRFSKRQ